MLYFPKNPYISLGSYHETVVRYITCCTVSFCVLVLVLERRYQIKFVVNILLINCNNGQTKSQTKFGLMITQTSLIDITRDVRTQNVLKISTRQGKLDCTEMSHLDEDIAYSSS